MCFEEKLPRFACLLFSFESLSCLAFLGGIVAVFLHFRMGNSLKFNVYVELRIKKRVIFLLDVLRQFLSVLLLYSTSEQQKTLKTRKFHLITCIMSKKYVETCKNVLLKKTNITIMICLLIWTPTVDDSHLIEVARVIKKRVFRLL